MALQQFRQEVFVDGNFAGFQSGNFGLVVVDQDHFVSEVGKTRTRNQSHITRTYDCNMHPNNPSRAINQEKSGTTSDEIL